MSVKNGESSTELRFSAQDKEDYESSTNGKIINWSLFFMSVALMWGYYTMLTSQFVFQILFENPSFSFVSMITITVPECAFYSFLLITGLNHHEWMSFTARVCITMISNAILAGIIILGVLELYTDEDALIAVIYAVGCGVALGQALFEPAVYELSAIFPSSQPTQMCAWGTGMAGILNVFVNILIQLCITGTSGDPLTADQARYQEVGFCAAMIIVSLSNIAVYWYGIRKNPLYAKYIEEDDSLKPNKNPFAAGGVNTTASALESSTAMATGDLKSSTGALDGAAAHETGQKKTETSNIFEESSVEFQAQSSKPVFHWFQHFSELKEATRIVWPGALAIYLCYLTSLTIFPNIPGLMCLGSNFTSLQPWWFNFILLAYNLGDFIGRTNFPGYDVAWAAENVTQHQTLGISLVRMALIASLIFTSCAPQLYDANVAMWVALLTVLCTGLSNGWISTSSLMRAPKHPSLRNAFLAKQAGCVSVFGLLFGISSGTILSWILGEHIPIGDCHQG